MSIEPLVLSLLEEVDSGKSPEEACAAHPEMLGEIRARLSRLARIDNRLQMLFPGAGAIQVEADARHPPNSTPEIPGHVVESVLGRGGMGVVYKARHLRLNRLVAVKMMLHGGHSGPSELARFHREAEALAAVGHPNIVQIHEVGDLDGLPYFTMEYVAGDTLAQRLNGVPLACDQVAPLLATIAEAVHAAHRVGIVHRDLKPANLLMATDGSPKVTDFGLAWRHQAGVGLTWTGARMGTPSYMAPEQAAGLTSAIGNHTDVYSLGSILYEMITGRPPFRAETAIETERQVVANDPVPPSRLNSRVPRDLETICLKCLSKEPQKRYATAAALAEDLKRFQRGDAIAARPEGWIARLARRIRRRPLAFGAVALAVVLTFTVVGGAAWLTSERSAAARAAEADLQEMAESLRKSDWPQANADLERAKGRVGVGGSADLRLRIDQGGRDLDLAARLDAMRLARVDKTGSSLPFVRADEQEDEAYERQFFEAGFGRVRDDVEGVAKCIRRSHIRAALVAALDDWAVCTRGADRRGWILKVARMADPDPTGWGVRIRDPEAWGSRAALINLTESVPVGDRAVSSLVAIAHYLEASGGDPIPFLTRVQQAHPSDLWANYTLANKLRERHEYGDSIRYYQAALTMRPRTASICNNLALSLMFSGRFDEATQYLERALAIEPAYNTAFGNLGILWFNQGQYEKSLERLQQAVKRRPEFGEVHHALGLGLERKGMNDEALSHYRRAVELAPKLLSAQRDLRRILILSGRTEEALSCWAELLESDPDEHEVWFGHAELCLFLGREDEYLLARKALLAKFGETADPNIAERTARACLVGPAAGDELRKAVALAERAAGVERSEFEGSFPYFEFVRGLAEYRQGRFDRAIETMGGDAAGVIGPAPRLVLAMAMRRAGRAKEAREALDEAVKSHDWRAGLPHDHENWIVHVLRREAEALIIPKP
ncbi:serine/threonine-protein kinase [Paludisphaera mucosa]|uniref:Serine/threonine-protein kinase n=1 Tax=Paludisphaera mucosa TaxID=3030827 RepID=A0ABT6FLH1_9BACT|nr:serine/threonine-protein kinase [Paludisphaera mucosa]MDG3008402.1 serine/threonine-protein kinase [Paludisphaera mucosa]